MSPAALFMTVISLVLVYGFGSWLSYQNLKWKKGLPTGSFTGKYGYKISLLIKIICWVIILLIAINFNIKYLFLLLIFWLPAGTITRFLERRIYSNYNY